MLTGPQTESETWKERVNGIVSGASFFFKNQVMVEVACEPKGNCNVDQRSFKAYLSRMMAATTQLAPFTAETIMPLLQASAKAAALQCSGTAGPHGSRGNVCGMRWTDGAQYDGSFGVGEQMAALEIFQANLVHHSGGPLTNSTGGTSKGDPTAGGSGGSNLMTMDAITGKDRAGAAIITTLVLVATLFGAFFMVSGS